MLFCPSTYSLNQPHLIQTQDGDGQISLEEMYKVLKEVLQIDDDDVVADLAVEVVSRADIDGNCAISFEEFVAAVEAGVLRLAGEEEIEDAVAEIEAEEEEGGAGFWLSPDEAKMRTEFDQLDLNGDNMIDFSELATVLRGLYGDTVEDEVLLQAASDTIEEYDIDGDGSVSFDEFAAITSAVKQGHLRQVFAAYDLVSVTLYVCVCVCV